MKCNDDNSSNSNIDLTDLESLICFCFKYSKQELFNAIKENKDQVIIDEIKRKMKVPGCFCETANPSGKCCLADINAFVKLVQSKDHVGRSV